MLTFGIKQLTPSDASASDISAVEYGQRISVSCEGMRIRSEPDILFIFYKKNSKYMIVIFVETQDTCCAEIDMNRSKGLLQVSDRQRLVEWNLCQLGSYKLCLVLHSSSYF
jgi:hypothetical protein